MNFLNLILFMFVFLDANYVEQRECSNPTLPYKKRKVENIQTEGSNPTLPFKKRKIENMHKERVPYSMDICLGFQYPNICEIQDSLSSNATNFDTAKSSTCISKVNNDNSINRDDYKLKLLKDNKNITVGNNYQSLTNMNPKREGSSRQIYGEERNDPSSISKSSIFLVKHVKCPNDTDSQHQPNKDWPILLNKTESEKLKNLLLRLKEKRVEYKKGRRFYYTPKIHRACAMFSEIFIILCLGIKNNENEESIKNFFESFYAKFKEHKISFRDNNVIFYERRNEIRQEIVEVLKKELNNYDDKIKIYEKLIELEKKAYEIDAINPKNQNFAEVKYISYLYIILFLLSDDNEVKLFEKQIDNLICIFNSKSVKHDYYAFDFTGIDTKNLFDKIYGLANAYYHGFDIKIKTFHEKHFNDKFNKNFKAKKSWCENNPNKELRSMHLFEILRDFEAFKSILKGCTNKNTYIPYESNK